MSTPRTCCRASVGASPSSPCPTLRACPRSLRDISTGSVLGLRPNMAASLDLGAGLDNQTRSPYLTNALPAGSVAGRTAMPCNLRGSALSSQEGAHAAPRHLQYWVHAALHQTGDAHDARVGLRLWRMGWSVEGIG